ncbi:MAG: DMT family transporter [Campylobacterales bacterium]|nr:DMT family transporter [Campylobacterales bacterium]
MAFAVLCIPLSDSLAKWLTVSLSPGEIAWGRFLFQTLLLMPIALQRRERFIALYFWLGLSLTGAILLLFWGLKTLPVANNIALFFVEPLLLTLLCAAFLKETISKTQMLALAGGLLGALIVIRPNWAQYGVAALLPIGSALCYAIYLTLTRVGKTRSAFGMQYWVGGVSTLVLTIALVAGEVLSLSVFAFVLPTLSLWGWLFVLGFMSTVLHLLFTIAFRKSDASVLASFQYLEIITALLLGWLVFREFPDPLTLLGAGIIILSGIIVFRSERKIARANARPVEAV